MWRIAAIVSGVVFVKFLWIITELNPIFHENLQLRREFKESNWKNYNFDKVYLKKKEQKVYIKAINDFLY